MRRITVALLALCVAAGPGGGDSSWAKKSSPTQNAFEAALDAKKADIVDCVMEYGIKKGASSVRLDIKVLVNRQGQPFGVDLQVTQKGGDQAAMSVCVKKALELTHFPPSKSALTELRRQWTFAAQ
jgi:hypothetical protein